ncbi:unnamed protein product [Blepharisma stoltei]|uniref:CCDC81 HU domain-containing protein n=1 Tax=Blepharisma stoltei TaxID=1481888 RepID=A0AAU9JFA5_9CILI|nr:unnamed protein product [Blepharisma stoltei]
MQVSELELFKEASKEPKFLYQYTDAQVMKILYKVWSGFTKFIRSLIMQGRNVNCMEFGRFICGSENKVKFIPNQKFLSSGGFSSHLEEEKIDKSKDQHISYSAIAYAANLDREVVNKAIKEIIGTAIKVSSSGRNVKLDMRVGVLIIGNKTFEFKYGLESGTRAEGQRSPSLSSAKTPSTSRCTIFRPDSEQSAGYHPSNPNPRYQGLSPVKLKPIPEKTSETSIPWPYLPEAYNDKVSPGKGTKKLNIPPPISARKLLNDQRAQIEQKKEKKETESKQAKEYENKLIKDINQRLISDRESKEIAEWEKKLIFIEGNKKQLREHDEKRKKIKEERNKESYDYFPFTHGDALEQKQREIKEEWQKEMNQVREKSSSKARSKLSDSYIAQYPVWLKQDEYAPIRRINEDHVEIVMDQALQRYEEQLQKIEEENVKREELNEKQDNFNKAFEKLKSKEREKAIRENENILREQMKEKKLKKKKETTENKELENTNFGPDEGVSELMEEAEEQAKIKMELKEALQTQIKEKHEKLRKRQKEEREMDISLNQLFEEAWENEQMNSKLKSQANKNLYKEVWLKQMKMRQLQNNLSNE